MNTPRRKSDILVVVFSMKQYIPGESFAQTIADQINRIFENTKRSVSVVGLDSLDLLDEIVGRVDVLIVDKSLGHDQDGTDGIDLVARIQELHPYKMFIAMSSSFNETEKLRLIASGTRFFLKKPMPLLALRDVIEGCINIMEIQKRLDSDFWDTKDKM